MRYIVKKLKKDWIFWQVIDSKTGILQAEFESYNYQAPMKRAKEYAKMLNEQAA